MPITFKDVFFTHDPNTPLAANALKGVNFEIEDGSFFAIVGKTGCGKSTLIQHINALLTPMSGEIRVGEFVNHPVKKKRQLKKVPELRREVGVVFQFPEYQLFEETVEKDVAFAPKNFGLKEKEALDEAHKALSLVDLDESFYKRSPFDLSGGEKRRVAIAGVLAFKPKVLVIDEPTAGLDPVGAEEMMSLFQRIHDEGTTIILVTHDMDIVLKHADKVAVMDDGKCVGVYDPKELFKEDISSYSLDDPLVYGFAKRVKQKGLDLDVSSIKDVDSLADAIIASKGGIL
ncbi:MAG: energy-coupling factor transporter ATPase [Bacilli bacterium]|nr:energy-coupling factor transporter ATPase [Bacilli bacterium]